MILTGETTLYGEVKRVGGFKPRVVLKTIQGDTIYCDASKALAQELGRRLYTEVGVRGQAKWNMQTLRIDAFIIESVPPLSLPEGVFVLIDTNPLKQ